MLRFYQSSSKLLILLSILPKYDHAGIFLCIIILCMKVPLFKSKCLGRCVLYLITDLYISLKIMNNRNHFLNTKWFLLFVIFFCKYKPNFYSFVFYQIENNYYYQNYSILFIFLINNYKNLLTAFAFYHFYGTIMR